MTVTTEIRSAGPFIGDGTVQPYPFAFKVFAPQNVAVYLGEGENIRDKRLTFGADFTVTLNAEQDTNPGGVMNLVSPLPPGDRIAIVSEVPFLQETHVTNFGNFYPVVLNNSLDWLTILVQQVREETRRSVSVPATSDLSPEEYLDKYSEMLDEKVSQAGVYADAASDSAGESATSAGQSANSAQSASDSAQQIHSEYEEVMNFLKSLPDFVHANNTFHGLFVGDDMCLYWDKAVDGETIDAGDYPYLNVLPAEARFYMDGGSLCLELPIAQ